MYTGVDDIYKVGQISQWNNMSELSSYFPGECSMLSGSAGEFFPQDRDKTSLTYFTPDLCRPIFFNFKEETTYEGISGYKYVLDEGFIGNSSTNSSNACYNPHLDNCKNLTRPKGLRLQPNLLTNSNLDYSSSIL